MPPLCLFRRKSCYFALPILNIVVPHTGHLPFVAGLPFFIVVASAPDISRCVLHFKQ